MTNAWIIDQLHERREMRLTQHREGNTPLTAARLDEINYRIAYAEGHISKLMYEKLKRGLLAKFGDKLWGGTRPTEVLQVVKYLPSRTYEALDALHPFGPDVLTLMENHWERAALSKAEAEYALRIESGELTEKQAQRLAHKSKTNRAIRRAKRAKKFAQERSYRYTVYKMYDAARHLDPHFPVLPIPQLLLKERNA